MLAFYDFNIARVITTENVGYIKPLGSDIRIRGRNEQGWNKIAQDSNVFRNDSVFTGEKSQARIKLRTNERFTLEPNSLVVLSDKNDKQTVEFSKGGFFAELKKGAKLFIKFKNEETEISSDDNASFRMTSDNGKDLKLIVLRGEAEIKRNENSEPEKIKANQELEVSKPGAQPVKAAISLQSPAPGAENWNKEKTIAFEWKKTVPTPSKIEISSEPDFSSNTITFEVDSDKKQVQLPEYGTFFWRVVDAENPESQSVVSSFSVYELVPPKVASRTEKELVEESDDKNSLTLSWDDPIASDKYKIEISSNENFSSIDKEQDSVLTSARITNLKPGKFFWRVRSTSEKRADLLSNTGELIITEKVREVPPVAQEVIPPTPEPEALPIEEEPAIAQEEVPPEEPTREIAQETKVEKVEPVIEHPPERKIEVVVAPPPPPPPPPEPLAPAPPPLIAAVEKPTATKSAFLWPEFWVWVGAGMNYQLYKQNAPGVDGDLTFQNLQGPTTSIHAGFMGPKYGFDASLKNTPGEIISSDTITVTNGKYQWQTLSLEGIYHYDDYWRLLFGIQHHSMPFMALGNGSSGVDIQKNTLSLVTLGFENRYPLSDKLRFEWLMRYQYPFLAGGQNGAPFKVKPEFAFDGSLGGVYPVAPTTRLGLYWYGQWHQYSFDHGRGTKAFSGKQTLFYSNIELRLGFEF